METQLTLFTLLTDEQEKEKNRKIQYIKKQYLENERSNKRKRDILLFNGFIEGTDFVYEGKWKEEEINIRLWEDAQIKETIGVYKGFCYLRYKTYYSSEKVIKFITYDIDLNKDGINCYGLTHSQRYIKPKTLLQKLRDKNIRTEIEYTKENKDQSILEYTINKYKKLYPEAEIKADRGYNEYVHNYEHFNTVNITFKSKSYLILRLGYENNKEFLYKKHDAVVSKMSTIQLLDMFNEQLKIN